LPFTQKNLPFLCGCPAATGAAEQACSPHKESARQDIAEYNQHPASLNHLEHVNIIKHCHEVSQELYDRNMQKQGSLISGFGMTSLADWDAKIF
jgi:hypothetical protein